MRTIVGVVLFILLCAGAVATALGMMSLTMHVTMKVIGTLKEGVLWAGVGIGVVVMALAMVHALGGTPDGDK